jgi:hypothetical protein
MTSNSLCAKLSHMLVLTGWWALLNCNVILNCAGLSRRFSQKLQDVKHNSSSELARPTCIIHWNGWRITWGTQLERRVLRLESSCYNKSHLCAKLSASLRLLIESPPCLFQALLDFPKYCQHIIHFQLCTPWFTSIIQPYRCGLTSAFL